MKRFSLVIAIILVVFLVPLLAGCSGGGSKNNVAGTWVMKEDSLGIGVGMKLTLKDDGTAAMGPVPAKYKVSGSTVSITNGGGKELLALELKDGKLVSPASSSRKVVYEKE